MIKKSIFSPHIPFSPRIFPFYYGWVILWVTTIGVMMSIPGQTTGVSVFSDHLIQATQLSRLELSNTYMFGTLISALLLPWGGSLMDRWGARMMAMASGLLLSLTLLYLSKCDDVIWFLQSWGGEFWQQHGAFLVMLIGFTCLRFSGQGMLTMTSRTTLARWFHKKRGQASAISGLFVAFSFAAAPWFFNLQIEGYGWRETWQKAALVIGITMPLLAWIFFRENPEESGLVIDGNKDQQTEDEEAPSLRRREAIGRRSFWLVSFTLGLHALVLTGITFHIVDIGKEIGLSKEVAVGIFIPMALVSTTLGYLIGLACDRVSLPYLFMGMLSFSNMGYLSLFHYASVSGKILTILGLGGAGAFFGPLSVVAMPYFFGRTYLGSIMGLQTMILVMGSALGPTFLAFIKSHTQSYQSAFWVCSLFASLLMILALTTSSNREVPQDHLYQ